MDGYTKIIVDQEKYYQKKKLDLEMMEKYGIKDLTQFIKYGVAELYYKLRLPHMEQKMVEEAQRGNVRINLLNANDEKNRQKFTHKNEEEKFLLMRLK
jgi:hypothetical protein